jgi:hypothetical protein
LLRHFGANKEVARDRYREFVTAGIKQGHYGEFYAADEGRIPGSEEFIEATNHRLGETGRSNRAAKKRGLPVCELEPDRLVAAVARVCSISRADFCGTSKRGPAIMAKEMLILIGLQMSASMKVLAEIIGISPSAKSTARCGSTEAARQRKHQQAGFGDHSALPERCMIANRKIASLTPQFNF